MPDNRHKKAVHKMQVATYTEVLAALKKSSGKRHLLLGNGFSIGAHALFRYGSLYSQAQKTLPERIQGLFDHYGTTNFEQILRHLDEGAWLAKYYGLKNAALSDDYGTLKKSLIGAISGSHPPFPTAVGEQKLKVCADFIAPYDDVSTFNYDLLLYWASLVNGDFPYEDGFGREVETSKDYCIFLPTGSSAKHLYYLHGALHLYADEGEVKKRVWNTTGVPLIDQVREALESKRYPLVVSEGDRIQKMEHIEASSYLSYCWRKFENFHGALVVFGHSLSAQDQHVLDAIAKNTGLSRIFIGLHSDPSAKESQRIIATGKDLARVRHVILESGKAGRRMKKEELAVEFFDSKTADVWGAAK